MIPQYLQDCLNGTTGSYIRPLVWYGGESKEKLIEASSTAQNCCFPCMDSTGRFKLDGYKECKS